ncbi:MAG: protein kinase [Bryobacterales bacterium]|nr:protein kinase [Bryobacterales bacterium]
MRQPESAEDFRRIRELFEAALEQAGPGSRAGFLESACAGDPAIRAEVERLLRHHDQVAAHMEPELPRFGPYQTSRIIGRGGMGLVYEAHRADGQFDRRVAIKVAAAGTLARGGARQDLREERQTLANLIHPHIAQLYDGGVTPAGEPYLVVEYVEGKHLDVHCDEHRLTPAARLQLLAPILDAVEFTHRHGVIHQDLKPSNILVTPAGQPKLLDFGVSRLLHRDEANAAKRLTPGYASPEAMAGGSIDARADVYSLGVIYSKLLGPAARPAIVRKAAAPDPASRYQSIAELREALFPRNRRRWAAVGAAVVLVASGAGWMIRSGAQPWQQISPPAESWREASLAWSGDWMAFAGGDTAANVRDIWVSHGDGSQAEQLFEDEFQDQDPTISSNGRYVAFRSNRQPAGIYEFDRSTRSIRSVAPGGHRPQYSPDGRWLMYATADERADQGRITSNQWFVLPVRDGGAVRGVAETIDVSNGVWSPDSQSVLLQVRMPQRVYFNTLWRRRLDKAEATLVAEWTGQATYVCGVSPDGQTLLGILGQNALGRIRLPAQSTASPERLAELPPLLLGCSTDRTGRVYVQQQGYVSRHYLLRPGGAPEPLPGPDGGYAVTSITWDGQVIAFRHALRGESIITGPFGTRPVPSTALLSGDGSTAWLQDNSGVARFSVVRLPDFRGVTEYRAPGHLWSLTGDGGFLLGSDGALPRPVTLLGRDLEKPVAILRHPQWTLYRARISVDGHWITFTVSDATRGLRVYLAPFRQAQPVPVTEWVDVAEGTGPVFSHAGDRLYFTSKRDGSWCLYEQALDPVTRRPAGEPAALAHLHGEYSAGELPGSAFQLVAAADGLRYSLGRQQHIVWQHQVDFPPDRGF